MSSIRAILEKNNPRLIVTPVHNRWLALHGDDPYPPHVVKQIAEFLGTKPRDRSRSFSASSAGTCLRAQELEFLGRPASGIDRLVSPELMAIFKDGKWRHLKWQADLLTSGIIQHAEFTLKWPRMFSRGTMDGLGVVPMDHPIYEWRGHDFGFELKGVNAFQWSRVIALPQPSEQHMRQVHRYFVMSGMKLFVVLYENKSTQAWHEWVVTPDKKLMEESMQEIEELNDARRRQKLHPMLTACGMGVGKEFDACTYGGADGTCVNARW